MSCKRYLGTPGIFVVYERKGGNIKPMPVTTICLKIDE